MDGKIKQGIQMGSIVLASTLGGYAGYDMADQIPEHLNDIAILTGGLVGLITGTYANIKYVMETEEFAQEQEKKAYFKMNEKEQIEEEIEKLSQDPQDTKY